MSQRADFFPNGDPPRRKMKPETAISGFDFGGLIAQLDRALPPEGFDLGSSPSEATKI